MKKIIVLVSIIVVMVVSLVLGMKPKSNLIQYDENTFIALTVNSDSNATAIPAKGSYNVTVSCTNSDGRWDYDTWELKMTNMKPGSTANCNLTFKNFTSISLADYVTGLGTDESNTEVIAQVTGESGTSHTNYRYRGKYVNNYVWFNDELWQIIGVFAPEAHGNAAEDGKNLVKLIRAVSLGGFAYDNNASTNKWGTGASLYELFNGNNGGADDSYYAGNDNNGDNCRWYSTTILGKCDFSNTGIKDSYRDYIQFANWTTTGGLANNVTAQAMYESEILTIPTATNTSPIGLMTASDFGLSGLATCAAIMSNNEFNSAANRDACVNESWLYGNNSHEWTLTPASGNTNPFFVRYHGYLRSDYNAREGIAVRPVLYLKSSVNMIGGSGSYNNPYIITK